MAMLFARRWIALLALAFLAVGCGKKEGASPAAAASFPPLPAPKKLGDGILLHEVTFTRGGEKQTLWIYLPEKPKSLNLPCVLIAPAGSPLLFGNALGEGDRPEHLPFVKADCCVVAYSIDGAVKNQDDPFEVLSGIGAFKRAHAGRDNTRAALDYALEKVPGIDKERIYTAGHSSAGTLALLAAQYDSRIKGCMAFAPCTDVVKRLGPAVAELSKSIPDLPEFIRESSPLTLAQQLTCPLFLFHANDDDNVPVAESIAFVNQVKKSNAKVTFTRVPTGGHANALLSAGMPAAIIWLKTAK